jgi:phage shock protein PspC (stress-responsive transcriptional regulator)
MIRLFRLLFEKKIFGVSSWWSDLLGVKVSFVRLFFIYAIFANAITILLYLAMIFILRLRYHFKYKKRKSVFDL